MPSTREVRLLLISPVRNEADHIARVAASLAGQTRRPDLWVVIDDGSEDGTLEILRRLEREIDFLRVSQVARGKGVSAPDRLAVAADARAFNQALEAVDWREFTHLGKLDGDIELPSDYLAGLLEEFERNGRLGVAGGRLVEEFGSRWRQIRIPDYHVHGALKLYTRDCFDAIGGIQERLGWDTIDETYARMRGYESRSFSSLVAVHHRHMATADGALRGRARHGRCAYIARYGLEWVVLRSFKVALERPIGLSGGAFLYGYLAAWAGRAPRVEDPAFRRFVRRELRRRLIRGLDPRALVRGRLASRGRQRRPKAA
jgi:biofilm PGA synthesis N-glycosyltransferase PgaC